MWMSLHCACTAPQGCTSALSSWARAARRPYKRAPAGRIPGQTSTQMIHACARQPEALSATCLPELTAASSALSSSWHLACCSARLSARASTSRTSGAGATQRGASMWTEGPSGADASTSAAMSAAVRGMRVAAAVAAEEDGAEAAAAATTGRPAAAAALPLPLGWLASPDCCASAHNHRAVR